MQESREASVREMEQAAGYISENKNQRSQLRSQPYRQFRQHRKATRSDASSNLYPVRGRRGLHRSPTAPHPTSLQRNQPSDDSICPNPLSRKPIPRDPCLRSAPAPPSSSSVALSESHFTATKFPSNRNPQTFKISRPPFSRSLRPDTPTRSLLQPIPMIPA